MLPTLFSPAHLDACFAADYAGAHARFRHACDRHEHSGYREFVYRQTGPDKEKLVTATAWLGNKNASRVLVLQSATHGVEGFCGSAIQVDCLDYFIESKLPDDLAILFIHALNPHGFAWLRRVNEDGIDLNRNFVDFNQPLPVNEGYRTLAKDILPESESEFAAASERLKLKQQEMGRVAYEKAMSGGQYEFADGLFYGGQSASQSRLYLEEIFHAYQLHKRKKIAVLDFHTGLGPFGYGEAICDHPPGSAGVKWAKRVYGDSVTEPALGSSSSVPKLGLVDYFWQESLGDRVCFITLEFGTYAIENLFEVLRHDHLLHRQALKWNDRKTQKVKQAISNHFYPATVDWQEMVLCRGRQVIQQAINGLQESS